MLLVATFFLTREVLGLKFSQVQQNMQNKLNDVYFCKTSKIAYYNHVEHQRKKNSKMCQTKLIEGYLNISPLLQFQLHFGMKPH